jgi:hypothetical protein
MRLRLPARRSSPCAHHTIVFDYPARRAHGAGAQHAPATETTAAAAPYGLGGYCRNCRNCRNSRGTVWSWRLLPYRPYRPIRYRV